MNSYLDFANKQDRGGTATKLSEAASILLTGHPDTAPRPTGMSQWLAHR